MNCPYNFSGIRPFSLNRDAFRLNLPPHYPHIPHKVK